MLKRWKTEVGANISNDELLFGEAVLLDMSDEELDHVNNDKKLRLHWLRVIAFSDMQRNTKRISKHKKEGRPHKKTKSFGAKAQREEQQKKKNEKKNRRP
jgi:hypothetical protein